MLLPTPHQPLRPAPVVDRLTVSIITDVYTDRYSVRLNTPGLTVARAGGTRLTFRG